MSSRTILLVGAGKMGGAMLRGWLAAGQAACDVHVVEPVKGLRDAVVSDTGVSGYDDVAALPGDFSPTVVILAVKPQVMATVLPPYARFSGSGTLFVSIAAGTTLGFLEGALGAGAAVVRAMPNTPAAIGRGMTVCCPNAAVSSDQRGMADDLMAAVGEVGWVEDEALMDPVTAVSGSGPAYVFHMIECMAAAGVAAGLPAELAARLARVTVAGAGELAYQAAEEPSRLRENVTSPNGTTFAALQVLMDDDGLAPLMRRAIDAATRRSRELAEG